MPAWRYTEITEHGERIMIGPEVFAGWHFCPWMDGILLGPGMRQFNECHCLHIDNGDDDA